MTTFASTIHRALLLFALPFLVHCAESSFLKSTSEADTGFLSGNDAFTTASSATYGPSVTDSLAIGMNIDATLAVSSGAIDLTQSTILATIYEGKEGEQERCTQSGILDVEVVDMPKVEDVLYGWWQVETLPSKTCTDVPGQLYLGIGAYNPLLDSAVTARGRDPQSLDYSVYVMLDPQSPLWVFGVADHWIASSSQQADSAEPVADSGLPNGNYSITGMLLIPL
jgi:hypothetical protein